ncbi:MAG: GNAT family N-acetyltransferase [Synergistales bacterium]|nr:GNAT family N-acetyltransferase [Synergistales bacterium]
MYLEETSKLPRKVVENLDGDIGNLKVYLVQDYNVNLLKRMVNFGLGIFGDLGMDEWGLVPQIRHGNVFVLKEEDKKRIIGLAILMRDWEDLEKCYLFDYAIAEDLQGQGLGYHFLDAIIRNLKDQDFTKMGLTVDTENAPAIRLYRDKIGFDVIGENKDEYGEGHHRYIMELDFDRYNPPKL